MRLTFPLKLVKIPDFHGWLNLLAGSTQEERKSQTECYFLIFFSSHENHSFFSILVLFLHVVHNEFPSEFCLFVPFFNALSSTIRSSCPLGQVLCHWSQWQFCHQGEKTSWSQNKTKLTQNQINAKGQQREASKRGRARVKTNKTDVGCIIWWVNHTDYGPRTT